jgi:hypothetical protein
MAGTFLTIEETLDQRPPKPVARKEARFDPRPHFEQIVQSLMIRTHGTTTPENYVRAVQWVKLQTSAEAEDRRAAEADAEVEAAGVVAARHKPHVRTSTYDADNYAEATRRQDEARNRAMFAREAAANYRAKAEEWRTRFERAHVHLAAAIEDNRILLLDPSDPFDVLLWSQKPFRYTWLRLAEAGYIAGPKGQTLAIPPAPAPVVAQPEPEPELEPVA